MFLRCCECCCLVMYCGVLKVSFDQWCFEGFFSFSDVFLDVFVIFI